MLEQDYTADAIRRHLERQRHERHDLLTSLGHAFDEIVASSRDSNADDEHDPEGSTIAFERAQLDAVVKQTRHQLAEIEAAIERLASKTYGVCETCGRPIAPARLEARPVARTCLTCASAVRH
jgi:DnaK suppressor protein